MQERVQRREQQDKYFPTNLQQTTLKCHGKSTENLQAESIMIEFTADVMGDEIKLDNKRNKYF